MNENNIRFFTSPDPTNGDIDEVKLCELYDNDGLNTDEMQWLCWETGQLRIKENLLDRLSHGWIVRENIYKINNRYFSLIYSYHDDWGCDSEFEFCEVIPQEVTTITYVKLIKNLTN